MKNNGYDDDEFRPMTPQDNANHRKLWAEREIRRRLSELVKIWLTTIGTVITVMAGAYTLWQSLLGRK
jgi:membrane protein YqaA with SNARE-associated domain